MNARPAPAAPAPPPLQASVTWANPWPSLYQFPSYTARLNENPNPNPNPDPFFNPSDGYCSVGYGSFKRAPSPKKGISSEGFAVHENITNYWPRNNDTSLSGLSGYGYGWSGPLQECPPYYLENPYKISESSAGLVKCTTPYSVSGHITNSTTPSNILKASHHVENGTMLRNISQPSIQVPSSVPNPTPSFQQSDTVLVKKSGFQFSSKPIENAKMGKFQKVPNRIGRVRPHPHKSTQLDFHKEEKVEVINAGKVMEAKDNQRTQLEQVESATQSMSMDGNAVQHSSSCRLHTSASLPGDTVGAIGSSVLMAEDAPLDVILEAFRYLSGILSSSDFDASELEDHDHELLQFIMDNRIVFTVKNKKDVTNKNFQDSRPKDAQSSIVCLKTDVTKLNKGSHDVEEKLLSVASNMNNDELESADHLSSSDLSARENVAQTVEKTFKSNFSNNEESLHAQVYEKLWIDAEAALCSLKYELQLAKMKIEVENCNHQTEKLQQSPKVSSLNSMHEHAEQEVPLMAKEENPAPALPTAKDAEVSPIITILSLKDQDGTPNSASKEHQLKSANFVDLDAEGKMRQLILDEMNKMRAVHVDLDTLFMPKEKNPPAAPVKYTEVADVMARLKVLKDRDNTPNSTDTIEQPNLDVLSDLEVRDANFCSIGSEIGPSTRKTDGEIRQRLDPSVCPTNTEAGSCETQLDSGGEASIFSAEWEFELL